MTKANDRMLRGFSVMNHQGLLWNLHCAATVVLKEDLNFKSAAIRSKRSSCSWWSTLPTWLFNSFLSLLSQHSFRYLFTSLSFNSISSMQSLRPWNARHSRHTIGSWNTRKSMGRQRFLRTKQQMHSLD